MDISHKIKELKNQVQNMAHDERSRRDRLTEMKALLKEIEERKARILELEAAEAELAKEIEQSML